MNGKKIVLLTTLIAFLILITVVAVFARFVLDIDWGEISSAPGKQETQQEQLPEDEKLDSNKEPENVSDQDKDKKSDKKQEEQ